VFISHGSDPGVELGFVRRLAERLAIHAHNVMARAHDLRRLMGGDAEVEAALKAAPLILVIVTRNYLRSEACLQELHWARKRQQTADLVTATPSKSFSEGQPMPLEQRGPAKPCRVLPVFRRGPDAEETSTVAVEDLRDKTAVEQLIRSLHPSAAQAKQESWAADLLWLGRLRAFHFGASSPECVFLLHQKLLPPLGVRIKGQARG
jgi:hypothetical protein